MPRIVDHERRREEVVSAALRVIGKVGIDRTTIREIAREAGCSTGALAHYFRDKDDILRSALEHADEQVRSRIRSLPPDLRPVAALREVLRQALPLDEGRAFELTLDVNFWARALNQPQLRSLQHQDHDAWRQVVLEHVRHAQREGELPLLPRAADVTDVLVAFVDGIGLQALVYPELFPPRRVERLLEVQLAALGAELPRRGARPPRVNPPSTAPRGARR